MHESAEKLVQHFRLNTEERRPLRRDNYSNYVLLYDAFDIADYVASNVKMADELEEIWKEVVVAKLK
jgi:hypothetical protein